MTTFVAILDSNNAYLGMREVDLPEPGEVVVPPNCDLPADGTYKWDEKAKQFLPLGHGFGKLSEKPPATDTYVLYKIAKLLEPDIGGAVREWVGWYERNLKRRDEERVLMERRKGRK